MRVDVDGNQVILVFVEGDFQRVKDEADVGFFKTVQRNELFLELLSKNIFGRVEWSTHSNLQSAGANDSGAFKACVLACWLDHEQSLARDSHVAEIATLFEPTSLFRPLWKGRVVGRLLDEVAIHHQCRQQETSEQQTYENRHGRFRTS